MMNENVLIKAISVLNEIAPSCGYPIYSSMDLRDSGWKCVCVDFNLFPAGFNNLDENSVEHASLLMQSFLSSRLLKTSPWKLAIIPEAHTNNQGYLNNLLALKLILEKANCECKIVWPGPPIPKPWTLKTKTGEDIIYHPIEEVLQDVDAVLLNHDMSGGLNDVIKKFQVPVFPNPIMGWYRRRKSEHFEIIDDLLNLIERKVSGFDKDFFRASHRTVKEIDLKKEEDRNRLKESLLGFFAHLSKKYQEKGIENSPSVYLKNDSGTYGLGVELIKSPEDVESLDSLLKKKFIIGKQHQSVSQIVLQEAIPTAYCKNQGDKFLVAEPVLYLVSGKPAGAFFRTREDLDQDNGILDSLNNPRASFKDLSEEFPPIRSTNCQDKLKENQLYYFLAKLHSLGAALEECPQ